MRAHGIPPTDSKYQTLLQLLKLQQSLGLSLGAKVNERTKMIGTSMNVDQLHQLKTHIIAYRYLSRNMALPSSLLQSLRNLSANSETTKKEGFSSKAPTKPVVVTNEMDHDSTVVHAMGVRPENAPYKTLFEEKEKRIKARMDTRMKELETLSKDEDANIRSKATLELKMLKLADFQKKMRAEIANNLKKVKANICSNTIRW
jgi:hypothetical protein